MKVKINQIELTNFRNIDYAKYLLSDNCVIEGENHIGKTNIILALYWTLTDKMLDGRSDSISVKPLSDTSKKVSVKLTLDADGVEHTIEKIYYENWTKKRGSSELTLTSHLTEYVIDEIKQKTVTEGLKEIAKILNINSSQYFELNKIDMIQALINPYYFGEILEWKQLRELIIKIIGDVENHEVYEKEPSTLVVKNTLEKYSYDFSKSLTYLNQQIQECNVSIKAKETLIQDLQKCIDLPAEQVKEAQQQVAECNKNLDDLKNGLAIENPKVKELQKEFLLIDDEIKTAREELKQDYFQKINEFSTKYDELNNLIRAKQKEINSLSIYEKQQISFKNKMEIEKLEIRNNSLKEQREQLLIEYRKIKDSEFKTDEHSCPNCGFVLNAEEIEKQKSAFETKKENDLNSNIQNGKQLKLSIENNDVLIKELKASLTKFETEINQLKVQESELKGQLNDLEIQLNNLNLEKPIMEYTSDKIEELINKRKQLATSIKELNEAPENDFNNKKLAILEIRKKYEDQLATHYAYLDNQRKIDLYEFELKSIYQEKINFEIQKDALNLFSKTKLEMLDQKLNAAFGEVKFVLIKTNITEGSWDQVCFPTIIGSNTPFINGSPSEKIVTGLKVIEAFKKLLNLTDLPILVDEIGQLDDYSINLLKQNTNSQLISTRVANGLKSPKVMNI